MGLVTDSVAADPDFIRVHGAARLIHSPLATARAEDKPVAAGEGRTTAAHVQDTDGAGVFDTNPGPIGGVI